jgi:outer membrane receptor protein involved in Fe transport
MHSAVSKLKVFAFVLALLSLMALGSGLAFGQRTTGTLRGQVLDSQGAVVVGATVDVTNQATNVSQQIVTTSAGTYILPSLNPGSYSVAVDSKGFKKFLQRDVPVFADRDSVADAKLEVGTTTETIEVTSGQAIVESSSSAIDNTFSSEQVLNVPVTGGTLNSALNMAMLAPNTIAQPGGVTGVGGAIGGTRPRDNNFTVDGVDDNNLGVTGPNSTVIFDAISEFSLQTNQFSAEYGHSAGGQFNLVTKTGTNRYHGSGHSYFQNRNLNSLDNLTKAAIVANTPGVTRQPAYDNNRFGGTFGGPVIKDKWFFFGAYEFTDLHGAGSPTNLQAPTSAGLSALNAMAVDSQVTNILKNFPVAPAGNLPSLTVNGTTIPVGTLTIVSPVLNHEHDAQANTDYNIGHHQISTRFLFNQSTQIFPVNDTQAVFNQNLLLRNRKVGVNDVWAINPGVVNDLRLQYSYFAELFTNPCTACPGDVTFADLGNSTIGPGDVQTQKQNTYQVVDNLSWAHGKHNFKFGGQYTHFIYPQFFLPRSNGDNQYNSLDEFVNDLLPGQAGKTLRNAGSGSFNGNQSLFAGFVQDDIKVTPRLTVNLGLRYEFWTNPAGDESQKLNAISNVPGVITFGVPKTDRNNIGPRVGFAYDPTGSGRTSIRGGFGIAYDVKFQNFASITLPPQVQSEMNPVSACALATPPSWCSQPNGAGFLAGGGLPAILTPPTTQAAARSLTTSFIDDTVMPKILTWSFGVQRELHRDSILEVRYLGTRGLSLPVQFRRNHISYFDGGGAPLPTFLSASSIPATYTATTPTDVGYYNFDSNTYSQFGFHGNVTADPPKGSSIYHAGSVNFTQRAGRGLYFNANYTYSHTIDNSTNEFFTSLLNPRRSQDTNQLGQDRGNSDLDVTHKFALSLSYDLPKVGVSNRFIGAVVNGFNLGSSFIAQSGQPVTLQSGIVDSNGNGDVAGDRAFFNPSGSGNVVGEALQGDIFPVCEGAGGLTYVGTTSFLNAPLNGCNANAGLPLGFDPAIGYTPANSNDKYIISGAAVQSNLGRNSFRSPGFGVWNLGVTKKINVTETKFPQLQAQVFNVLNHPNYALSNGNVFSNAGTTVATSTQSYVLPFDPTFLQPKQFGGGIRSMILSAKFVF